MKWIASQADFDEATQRLAAHAVIAVDTEADSLHSYFDKVCLIQISTPENDLVIDPLAGIDLKGFGELLANPSITKVFHGGDYDLRILDRDFGYVVSNLVDTMICAQLLGYESFGLAALLERHFEVKLDKVHQRADWAMRPLRPDMLEYAATDTRHLIALSDRLRGELVAAGRWEWAREEFERLAAVRFRENDDREEGFRRLKHIGGFDRRSLGIVRDLYNWRDQMARAADRPPFKIFSNDLILEVAQSKPQTRAELETLKPVSRYHADRYGKEIVVRVRAVAELPESELPERGDSKPWTRDRILEQRIDRLKKVRDRVARDLNVEPSVLAPRHVLSSIAALELKEAAALDTITAMREWQKRLLGTAFVDALRPAQMTL